MIGAKLIRGTPREAAPTLGGNYWPTRGSSTGIGSAALLTH